MASLTQQIQFLKENGFTEKQASTLVHFQKEHTENVMATKKDIALVKKVA